MAEAWTPVETRPAVDLFDKCDAPRLMEYRAADAMGLNPYYREMASQSGPVVMHEDKPVIMLGSNNYLGLTGDERVKRAAADAVERYGTGCTGSRLMNGTLLLHRELEDALAEWLQVEACLVFSTGWGANFGLVSTLVESNDAVFLDAASHASLVDGARMSAGTFRSFRHNLPSSLRHRLRTWQDKREVEGAALVAVDGVYSMEGDVAPVAEIASVCREYGARFLVDEAHALGVLGPDGRGAAAAAGVAPDLVMGTFSKALASCGGFIGGPKAVIDYLRIACRVMLFTAAGVPAAVAAALAALRIAQIDDARRAVVLDRARQLHAGLAALDYRVGPEPESPVVPIHIGWDWDAGRTWRNLLDRGVYTNCAVAPAVAPGRALLRTSVMATHTEEHIAQALRAFEEIRSTLD
ncbi:MAG TPA: aminotransferase class I/II-fold pyridoxal phosphate-dependent enzyme [Acidimicrobiales bacterium]|nr:aminotransferase class I/II-fold pyridoxal phosphate-dependent enzyme [Acidimicrobiales bacterium]